MELRARIRPLSRRAVWMTALVALIASALAVALAPDAFAKKRRSPVITSVAPTNVAVGGVLTIKGRHFLRGRSRNTVVFKRDGARAVFAKAGLSTRKMMQIKVPGSLQEFLTLRAGEPVPTRFRLRVLARKFGKKFTSDALSPIVSAPVLPKVEASAAPTVDKPVTTPPVTAPVDGDCDGDGAKNTADRDDDNDLLSDTTETGIGTDPCKLDTDEDGVEDGYEYRSARDLNDDEYQDPNKYLPYPGKRPYPNPLFKDADVDYDGDSLQLGVEFALWKAYRDPDTGLEHLIYSDGNQFSAYGRDADGRRPGDLVGPDPYEKYAGFDEWAEQAGYSTVWLPRGHGFSGDEPETPGYFQLLDFDQSLGVLSRSEQFYFDFDDNGKLSDDERDEDADGLTNYDEAVGRDTSAYWAACYKDEKPYRITYAGTDPVDPDSDGDRVRDGADDQDHDDVPNLIELSREAAASPRLRDGSCVKPGGTPVTLPVHGRVNPYNPCLPYVDSRTCDRHPAIGDSYAPFSDSVFGSYLILN